MDHVKTVAAVKVSPLVTDRQRSLPLELETPCGQLRTQTGLVGGFPQTWTKVTMHLDQRTDHLVGPILKSSDLPLFLCHPH